MTIDKIIKRGIHFFFCFCLISTISSPTATAQLAPKHTIEVNDTLAFSKSYFGISITPYITPAAEIRKFNSDRYKMNTTPQRGFEAAVLYSLHISPRWLLTTGMQVGYAGSNIRYLVPKEDFNPQPTYDLISERRDSRDRDANYVSVPLLVEKRWFHKSKHFWKAALGANFRLTMVQTYLFEAINIEGGVEQKFLTIDFEADRGRKPWINYNASVGHGWLLKHNDIISLGLLLNYSPVSFVSGNYRFTLPNKPVESGSYKLKGSFVGLNASYAYAGRKKGK